MLSAGAFLAIQFERVERRDLEEETKKVSRELASAVEREISELSSALTVLATSDSLHREDLERFDIKARKIAMAFPQTLIALRDLDGHVLLNSYPVHGAVLPKTIDPVLLETDRRALSAGRMVVSGVYTGAVTHVPFVSVELAVGLASGPRLLSIAIAAEHFQKLLLSKSIPQDWLVALVDADNRIITRTRNAEQYVGASVSSHLSEALIAEEGVLPSSRTREGTPVFTAFHRVANSGWYVVSSIPIDELVRPLREVWLGIGVLAVVGLSISFASAIIYGKRLAGAFGHLDELADTMGKGCPIGSASTGVRELDKLGSTLTQASRDLQALTAQRAELLSRLIDSQESERLRLSHELHDQTGQRLAAALLEIKRIESLGSVEQRERLRRLRVQIDGIGQILHRVAWELRPASISELGLAESLANLIEDWSQHSGIETSFHCSVAGFQDLREDLRTTIYRVIQEALTNVAKHAAGATQVTITLSHIGSIIRLVIEDNGAGFDAEREVAVAAKRGGGLGLVGMRERLSLLDGEIEIESTVGAGTTIFVRVPFEAKRSVA